MVFVFVHIFTSNIFIIFEKEVESFFGGCCGGWDEEGVDGMPPGGNFKPNMDILLTLHPCILLVKTDL